MLMNVLIANLHLFGLYFEYDCMLCIKCLKMSLVVRKPAFCICENKDADQLRSNCTADQRLSFPTWIVQSLF